MADRYELIEVIGSGGSATVWRAHDARLARAVAVKILLPGLSSDPTFQRRIEREARHIASLKGPNVVAIYDVGGSIDGPFIVMELVNGPSLREVLDRRGALRSDEVSSVAEDMLSALARAHRKGLVHRDIKPSNVLITAEGIAKLTDFGISRSIAQTTEITAAGLFTGTIAYSAPEQLAGESVSEASDLYSLGCVLYECLSGHPPFESDDVNRLAFQQRFADPPPIGERVSGLSPGLAQFVMRALEKDPGRRYRDASAMLAQIRESGAHPRSNRTIEFPAPTTATATERATAERSSKVMGTSWPGRKRALAPMALVVIALVVVAGVLWYPSEQRTNPSTLSSGSTLGASKSLVSPNGQYQLVMHPSGSLSLQVTHTGEPIWATGSQGHPGAYTVMRRDGNLVVNSRTARSRKDAPILYQTSTSGHVGATLHVLDDGNIVIEDPISGRWLWQSGSGPAALGPKLIATQGLHPLQTMRSPNGGFELVNDGWTGQLRLFAVRSPKCSIWVEPTSGSPASVSAVLPDGEFAMLAPLAHKTWTTGTIGNPDSQLLLGNNGALTLASASGNVIWQMPSSTSRLTGCHNR